MKNKMIIRINNSLNTMRAAGKENVMKPIEIQKDEKEKCDNER